MDIRETCYRSSCASVVVDIVVVRFCSVKKIVKSVEDLCCSTARHVKKATPYLVAREALCGKTGNDAEIVRTALKGTPKIRVLNLGGCCDRSVSQNDFIADDTVAD